MMVTPVFFLLYVCCERGSLWDDMSALTLHYSSKMTDGKCSALYRREGVILDMSYDESKWCGNYVILM